MKVSETISNIICEKFKDCEREYGGILGGRNDVITEFVFDNGLENENIGTYLPNVHFLNDCIDKWQSQNINFYGIIHNHLTEYAELSAEDIKCIEKIMNAMPRYIEYLYFPVISSIHILKAFKVIRTEMGIRIISENISIIL